MITITRTSREFTPVEKYCLTQNGSTMIKDVEDGAVIPVLGWAMYTDEKDNGDVSDMLAILSDNSEVYATQSKSFKRTFSDIVDVVDDIPFSIIKTSGTSKAGRKFVSCKLDVTSVR